MSTNHAVASPGAVPGWLADAVMALITTAYEAGIAEARAAEPVQVEARREYLTRQEASDMLRVSMTSLNHLIQSGDLPSRKVGARRMIRHDDLDAYMQASRTVAS